MSASTSPSASPPPTTTKEKKRKRTDPRQDELEIDVNLPEPPSKKALRRAKKGKTGPAPHASLKDDSDLREDKREDAVDTAEATTSDAAPTTTTTTTAAADTAATTKPARSTHGIWIGNLAFHTTPNSLKTFLTTSGSLQPAQITRINLPLSTRPLAPFLVRQMRTSGIANPPEFQNKGFAYVDFDSSEALFQALQLTEQSLEGRKVLVKDAKSFAGRPEKPAAGKEEKGEEKEVGGGKPRSKRIFVGNLAFDVTREDVEGHFAQAGEVEDVFLASFEDTGKCKGYGWVRFGDEDAAEKAVKGWVWKIEDGEEGEESEEEEGSGEDEKKEKKKAKGQKKRKWWINKLYGRLLRCEFAEDASTRYKKRYGKGSAGGKTRHDDAGADAVGGADGAPADEGTQERRPKKPFRGTQDQRQEQRRQKHRDARKVAPGMALASAPRASGAIVEGKGKKLTFDD
ncbi:hypothetical protein K461DRAFT_257324 [Myriangium duriaei CBS 260.36]|uniref:RRM domain-containing protein n=1 Tax=Myriangium duriaei CBS 260.36 TaxID=1168546 RepID=A0A9P4MLL6_9PEZI|nr:hypothetical protein K461DRAFT_257324 [Myriangium duriaei CBS 260.36]